MPPKRPSSSTTHGKLAYGTKKKSVNNAVDDDYEIVDRCHGLEKENLVLKEKENLLEREIRKMQTKLRRIEELMKSGKTYSDNDFSRLQSELEEQFGEFKDENTVLKERVRKLKIIQNGLSNKGYEVKSKVFPNKVSYKSTTTTQYHQRPASSTTKVHPYVIFFKKQLAFQVPGQSQPQHYQLVEELRNQLVKNEKEIIRLRKIKDEQDKMFSGNITIDDLHRKIRERESEIRDVRNEFDELELALAKKDKIFKDSKAYIEEISKQIGEARINNQTLSKGNIRLHIMASQAKSLNDQLKELEVEREKLESAIRNITSEPFFNREKGQSALKRIAELEEKLIEKEKHYRSIKEEETKKLAEFNQLQPQVERLRGEKDHLEKENKKLKDKFSNNNNLDEFNVYKTLFQMDANKYAQTMKDLVYNPDAYPIWANMDFLERGQQEQIDPNNCKALKVEIMKLRHENKDFAAELEKAQNLLQLQRDIEKDNSKYFESEKQRLMLMAKSSTMKAEELARRADEKQRQINDMTRKLGITSISRGGSPEKLGAQSVRQSVGDLYETQSEFSVMTNESEIKTDQNVLDFVVQDAEYYFDAFKQVLDERELMLHQKSLITFVTVDFYNHDTETSQIAEGFRPLYNTQFSFKNRIDDFFVQFLQKNTMRLDVYISKNNAAIHLGHAEILLRELIERETAVQDASLKTPIVQKIIRVFSPKGGEVPIGSIRFKMRMRRPISEAMRFYREKNEIANLKAQDQFIEGGSRKKLITVQIVGCKDIKVKYSGISQIAPFFYYHFYTFDERYSATAVGDNPIFEDTQNFEVTFDAKLINYLQKEPLEIILFDDNAPISGVDRGSKSLNGEQVDDMIGTVKIPLGDLIKGASIHERFQVRNPQREIVGHLEAKISIIDIDYQGISGVLGKQHANLHYNKQWENELVYRIAKKLAKFPGDVEMLFGIFSRGQKTVTKEDFKYTIMKRLQLKNEISEREIDMFLRGCPQILDKNVISLEDFVMMFSASITQARHDIQDEEAIQYQTIKKFEDMQKTQVLNQSLPRRSGTFANDDFARSQGTNVFRENLSSSRTNLTFNEQEIVDILTKIRNGNVSGMMEKIYMFATDNLITVNDFVIPLSREGNVSEFEANKVANHFAQRGKINVPKFEEFLKHVLHMQTINSMALQRFINLIQTRGDQLCQTLISLDWNKDGELNQEGMKACLLKQEFGFNLEDTIEVFQILQRDGFFHYREFLIEHNSDLRKYFNMQRSITPTLQRTETPVQSTGRHDTMVRQESDTLTMSSQVFEDPKLSKPLPPQPLFLGIIKNKLKNYIQTQDITLSSLFKIIDTNSDTVLSCSEFKQKMKALQIQLDDSELQTLFNVLDKTGKGTITYEQFVQEFPEINSKSYSYSIQTIIVSYMIKKIKNIIIGSKVAVEAIFNEFCSDKQHQKMNSTDFKKFVKKYIEKAADHEIDPLFRHFTNDSRGHLTLQDFIDAFSKEVKEQVFKIGIEDIIKPLATKVNKYKVNISQLFDKYDTNKNARLSAEELAKALKNDMNIMLLDDEIQVIKEYFKSKFNTLEIKKLDFIDTLNIKFQRKFNPEEAKQSLTILKQKLLTLNKTPLDFLRSYDMEKTRRLSLRNFKIALNSLKALSQYQIDNLAKFLDKEDDGFISIEEFDVGIRGVHIPLSSTGSFNQSGRRAEKWK